jgi:predicted anti-sigma-YlaC factor YlaD
MDGELSAADDEVFRQHLTSCSVCRDEIDSLGALSQMLSAPVAPVEPDPGFVARFRARRDEEFGSMGPWFFWRWLAVRLAPLAVAAVLVAVAAVWFSGQEEGLGDLEARELGNDLSAVSEEATLMDPVLSIALEPFPGREP